MAVWSGIDGVVVNKGAVGAAAGELKYRWAESQISWSPGADARLIVPGGRGKKTCHGRMGALARARVCVCRSAAAGGWA